MKLLYDNETDSLVIVLREGEIDDTSVIRPGVIADFDCSGSLISLEVLNASSKVESLREVTYNTKVLQVA